MTKLPELPEEIIGYILSFAPNYRDRLKACQAELLENKPIYYSTFITVADSAQEVFSLLGMGFSGCNSQVKYINGLGEESNMAKINRNFSIKKEESQVL